MSDAQPRIPDRRSGSINFDVKEHIVLQVRAGSYAYGTATAESDIDWRGVIFPPEEYFLGLGRFDQYVHQQGEEDMCYFDVRKFLTLALKGNPSVLEVYHAPVQFRRDPFAHRLLETWDMVVSKALVKPHMGMALSHLDRLSFPGRKCGTKGKKLIEKHKYNTKDAAQVIRVLEQCHELLLTGRLALPRPNAEVLRDIRDGKYELEWVVEYANYLVQKVKNAEKNTKLQAKPRLKELNSHLSGLVLDWLKRCRGLGEI